MKINRWLLPFGMIGVLSFLLLDVLGNILWIGYNPITTYISTLVADEAPHVHLMRFFMNTYTICFLIFSAAMMTLSFHMHRILVRGYTVMFVAAFISVIGYGGFPISMVAIFSKNDVVHVLVTVSIICATAICMLLIGVGYLKQEKAIALGCISLVECVLFIAFNLWHLYALLSGMNIVGLLERCSFYVFHSLTFMISWVYTFRRDSLIDYAIEK